MTPDMITLVQHYIATSAFFLVDKEGFLKKSVRSQLTSKRLKVCKKINQQGPETSLKTNAIVSNFMP